MLDFNQILTVTFTLFAVIDMPGSIPIIISLRNRTGAIQSEIATAASGFLMLLFLAVGERFLGIMGVDIKSFALAGSIVIFIIGLEMVLGRDFFKHESNMKSGSIVPIAFPIIAGSGTLTTIMSLKSEYSSLTIIVAIFINLLLIYLVLKSTNRIEKLLGEGGLTVVRKFFGLILLAIAIKIFKSNIHF
jgi:multiple antibiotic resistance protein